MLLHAVTDEAVNFIQNKTQVEVLSSKAKRQKKDVERISKKHKLSTDTKNELIKCIGNLEPSFTDKINSIIKKIPNEIMSEAQKRQWRRFFSALAILRNVAAHSNRSLLEEEKNF